MPVLVSDPAYTPGYAIATPACKNGEAHYRVIYNNLVGALKWLEEPGAADRPAA